LRKLLGGTDAIRAHGNGYVWNPEIATESDVNRFMAHCRRGTMEGYRDAIALYAGDFLAGETADWLQPMRVRLAAARATALEALTADALGRRDYAVAIALGLELLEAERGHEGGARLVMQAFAALDQRTRVLDQYLMLRRYLADEIGVEPCEETTALLRRLVGPVNLVWSAPTAASEIVARGAVSF
jgi:DNA-binding SARP family transcriptional activator